MNPMTDPDESKRAAQLARPEPPVVEPGVAPGGAAGGSGLAPLPLRWSARHPKGSGRFLLVLS